MEVGVALKKLIERGELDRVLVLLGKLDDNGLLDEEQTLIYVNASSRVSREQIDSDKGVILKEERSVGVNRVQEAIIRLTRQLKANVSDLASVSPEFPLLELEFASPESFYIKLEAPFESFLDNLRALHQELEKTVPLFLWTEHTKKKFDEIQEKFDTRRFKVAVMALMKAGKSTFLNSWIGAEFLPSSTVAETMRVVTIRHNTLCRDGRLSIDGKVVASGLSEIKARITNLNKEAREDHEADVDTQLLLEVDVRAFEGKEFGRHQFDILDTPGANEAGIGALQAKVERISKSSDVIIYLLDYTKLNVKDEKTILNDLMGWRSDLLKNFGNRLFFVVNRYDQANRHDKAKQFGKDEARKYVQELIKKHLGIVVPESDILLLSSEWALLSRVIQTGRASDQQVEDFKKIAFGEAGAEDADLNECIRKVPRILEKSGFAEMENKVFELIYSKSSGIFFESLLVSSNTLVAEIQNHLEVSRATLERDKTDVEKLGKKIAAITDQVNALFSSLDHFKKKALDEIQGNLRNLENKLTQQIHEVVREHGAQREEGLEGRFKALFGARQWILTTRSRSDIERLLNSIRNSFLDRLDGVYYPMLSQISENLNLKFNQFQLELQSRISPLLREIEKAIGEELDIQLNPVEDAFPQPTIESFYDSMVQSFGVVKQNRKSNLWGIQKFINKISNLFGARNVWDEEITETYTVSSKDVAENLRPILVELRKQTTQYVEKFVEDHYLGLHNNAKARLEQYSEKYLGNIQSEIKSKLGGVVDIPQRIQAVKYNQERIGELKSHLELLAKLSEQKKT